MARREEYFAHPSQLQELTPLLVPRRDAVVRLGGAMAHHPKHAAWERDLNRSYHACGCDVGAAGLIVGVIAGTAIAVAMYAFDRWTLLGGAGAAIALALIGATMGKVLGVLVARGRMKRIVGEIETEMAAAGASQTPAAVAINVDFRQTAEAASGTD